MIIPELTIKYDTYPLDDSFIEDWNKISKSAPGVNIFSSLVWKETAFRHFAPESDVLLPIRFINHENQTVAITLLQQTSRKIFGYKKTTWRTVDYNSMRLPVILAIDVEHIAGALKALRNEAGKFVDDFQFYKLNSLDGSLDLCVNGLRESGIRVDYKDFNIQPQLILPDNWNDYYYSHKKSFWKTIRYMTNKLGRDYGEVVFKRIRTIEDWNNIDYNKIIDDIFSVYQNSWQNEHREENSEMSFKHITDFYHDLISRLAYQGNLDLNIMYAGDKLCAFDLNLIEDKTIIALFGTYDLEYQQYSPGKLLLANWLKDSHDRGYKLVEFGGDYLEYKRLWTNFETPSKKISISGKTIFAKLKSFIYMFKKS